MDNKFAELTKGMAQSVTRAFLCLAVAVLFAGLALADDFRRGPLVQLSDLGPFRDCTLVPADVPGSGYFFPDDSAVEPYVAVNPRNPQHLVAAWTAGAGKGRAAAVSFDGGKRWAFPIVSGLTLCSGGRFDRVVDPWLTFAPNGDLYCISGLFNDTVGDAIAVSKSTHGGLDWGQPVILWEDTDGLSPIDKPSITADPADARLIYAVWVVFNADYSHDQTVFARSTNGGRSWEPASTIHVSGANDFATGHQVLVLPDGSLVCLFQENLFNSITGNYDLEISLIRSTDKGRTWSGRIRIAQQYWLQPTDPDTGHPVVAGLPAFAVDPNNGRLYAVWEDTRFSNGQYSSIAFAQSTDGGLTWSEPIPVNRTSRSIAPANRQTFLPLVAVAANGTIGITYYDFRFNDVQPGCLTDYWLVQCHPTRGAPATNPANWSQALRLTDASFDLEKAVDFIGSYMLGDYLGLTAAGNDFVTVFAATVGAQPNRIFFRRAISENHDHDNEK